jgi:RimJ/RimL family protein N-acetyltransferase
MGITTERLLFSRLSPDDFPQYASLATNKDVMKYITGNALTINEAEQRFQKALEQTGKNPDAGVFIVRNKDNGELIGISKLIVLQENQAEVGYMLLPESWGYGFASEMVKCMLDLNKEKSIASEIIGIVDPENPASIRVLTKFGFRLFETGQIDGLAASYYKLELNKSKIISP